MQTVNTTAALTLRKPLKKFWHWQLACSVALLVCVQLRAATEVLPGLTFYGTRGTLTGELAFLYTRSGFARETNSMSAELRTLNLQTTKFQTVTPAPDGIFVISDDGKVACVLSGEEPGSHNIGTNVFVYSREKMQSRVVHFPEPPRQTVIVDHHVFFKIETNSNERLIDFNFSDGSQRMLELPGASRWTHVLFKNPHRAIGSGTVLHFEYSDFGKRLSAGKDYDPGFYSMDVISGAIQWYAKRDDEPFSFKSADGKYVWFEGRDAPIHGRTLIVSSFSDSSAEFDDPKGKTRKVLQSFSLLSSLTGGTYTLKQMSPCRSYALIELAESIAQTKIGHPGWVRAYFVVNVATGESKLLLKDEVQRKTVGYISEVRWVEVVKP